MAVLGNPTDIVEKIQGSFQLGKKLNAKWKEGASGKAFVGGFIAEKVTEIFVIGKISGILESSPGLGDLTHQEVNSIQSVVDQAGRLIEVAGSAAKGTRCGVGTDLPIGKGPGTRSDIDYLVTPGSVPYYQDLQIHLPSIDPKSGIIVGSGNPFIGPYIRFEPGAKPQAIPQAK